VKIDKNQGGNNLDVAIEIGSRNRYYTNYRPDRGGLREFIK